MGAQKEHPEAQNHTLWDVKWSTFWGALLGLLEAGKEDEEEEEEEEDEDEEEEENMNNLNRSGRCYQVAIITN